MIATGMMDPTTQFTCFTLYIRKSYWGVMLISNLANLFPLGKKHMEAACLLVIDRVIPVYAVMGITAFFQ